MGTIIEEEKESRPSNVFSSQFMDDYAAPILQAKCLEDFLRIAFDASSIKASGGSGGGS